jgi:hypothetical protein
MESKMEAGLGRLPHKDGAAPSWLKHAVLKLPSHIELRIAHDEGASASHRALLD